MTLGPSIPRALCPHCIEEGHISSNQQQDCNYGPSKTPLGAAVRFECANGHVWQTPLEDAELFGAFLDRQPAP